MRFLSFMLRKITVCNRLISKGLTLSVSGKQNRFPLIKLALVTGRDPPKQLSGWNAMLIGDLAQGLNRDSNTIGTMIHVWVIAIGQ
jgi:hypothetical protein